MKIITKTDSILYLSDAGDWGLRVTNEQKEILPQVGELVYQSGANLDNLAQLVIEAKEHATQNGIIW